MNKKDIIIVLLVIVTVVALLFGVLSYNKASTKTITIYQKTCNLENIRNCETVQVRDLSVKLTDFFFNGQYPEDLENVSDRERGEHSCSQRLKFSSTTEIQSVLYDWFVYDNNNNILATSLVNVKEDKEIINYLKEARKVDLLGNFDSYGTPEIIIDSDNPVAKEVISRATASGEESKYDNDFEQVHVLIINPRYQLYGNSEYIELKDTIIEFIVNK